MKFKYKISNFGHITIENIFNIFPKNISIDDNNGNIFLIFEHDPGTTENDAYFCLQRETDRVFFLTGINIQYDLVSIENDDGSLTAFSDLQTIVNAVAKLPHNINRQQWASDDVSVHLRLWFLAFSPHLPLAAKVNLLFQIIEIEYPDTGDNSIYPAYDDSNIPPDSKTESKLLRHLMSHGNTPIGSPQLREYCIFLGISPEMHNPTNPQFISRVNSRLSVLKDEALRTIDEKISRS